jgi:hypothetical protein
MTRGEGESQPHPQKFVILIDVKEKAIIKTTDKQRNKVGEKKNSSLWIP